MSRSIRSEYVAAAARCAAACEVDRYCVTVERILVLLLAGELALLRFGLLLRDVGDVPRGVGTIAVDGLTLCCRHRGGVGRFRARHSLLLLKLGHLSGELLLTDTIGLVALRKKTLLSFKASNLLRVGRCGSRRKRAPWRFLSVA